MTAKARPSLHTLTPRRMKRASYRDAIDFIAWNDEPACTDAEEVRGLASVLLVASIFDVTTDRVATDVVRHRLKHQDQAGDDGRA